MDVVGVVEEFHWYTYVMFCCMRFCRERLSHSCELLGLTILGYMS